MDKDRQANSFAWCSRIGIGTATAVSLHLTIYGASRIVMRRWERSNAEPVVFGDSPWWLALCLLGLLALIWWGRPRLIYWVAPFTLGVVWWFFAAAVTGWHPDTPEESQVAAFSLAMFLICFCVWGCGVLLALVRWVLSLFFVRGKPL